ncbi:hypothetical protein CMV_010100 [Castanea mollissima]|uniref:Uncharacterized protein n=1 Tax=Castanea mollissima TaxID=60419 RepID=A0A8J4RNF5_9ROSI|nr:hypothetical protein CMV_010100 [Castanea mollissima]
MPTTTATQNTPPLTPSSFAPPLTPLLTTISSLSPSLHNPNCRCHCHPSLCPSLPSPSLLCHLPLPSPNFDIYAVKHYLFVFTLDFFSLVEVCASLSIDVPSIQQSPALQQSLALQKSSAASHQPSSL